MTRNRLIINIQQRLKSENNIELPKETIGAMINILEDEIYMVIANEDELSFVWGRIYGEERAPRKISGKYAEFASVIQNEGYAKWKRGYPKVKWSKAALINDSHPAREYFELPEHRYTTKAREFRKHTNTPEIPEYAELTEEEIVALCKKADKIEFEALPKKKQFRKKCDDQSNMVKKIGSAMYWESNDVKPYHSLGEFYKGEQRDGVTDYLDHCYHEDMTLPEKLEIIRRAIDIAQVRALEDRHPNLKQYEAELVEQVKKAGLKEMEHSYVVPDAWGYRLTYNGETDPWNLEEQRKGAEEKWREEHGIPLEGVKVITRYQAISDIKLGHREEFNKDKNKLEQYLAKLNKTDGEE